MRDLFPALLVMTACASTRASDVHLLGQQGDMDGLVAAWKKAGSDEVRIAVLEELAAHAKDDRGRSIVLGQAASADAPEPLQLAAVRAAGAYEGGDAARVLIARLGDPFPSVRSTAEEALAPKSGALKSELMIEMASSANPLIRAGCVRLLAAAQKRSAQSDKAVEDAIIERATHEDAPRVREAAVTALGMLDVSRARAALVERMRTDEDPAVRQSAERALQKLGEAGASTVIVAVLPLKNDTGLKDPEIERLGSQIAEYVAARLSQGKVCQVVDREKVEQAIAEMKKVGALLYDGDAPNAPEIGRFKIANQLVYGSVQKQGLIFTIVLDRMDVATLAHVPGAAVTVQGYRADIEALKAKAADQLMAQFR